MPKATKTKGNINLEVLAENLFTDRTEPRQAFWDVYNKMESGDYEILYYYGVGGVGKTTLLNKIGLEMDEKIENGKYDHAFLSFEEGPSKEEFLFKLSRQMMIGNKELSFPLFEAALKIVCEKEGKDIVQLEAKAKDSLTNNPIIDAAISAGDLVLSGLGAVNSVFKAVEYIVDISKKKIDEKKLTKGEYSEYYPALLSKEVSEIKKYLQVYFVKDIYDYFDKRDTPYVVFIDGYETLVNVLKDGELSKTVDWWIKDGEDGLVNIPNVLWVMAGREKIEWDKNILPDEHLHRIGDLSENDTVLFLEKAGVDAELRYPLYAITNGTPLFLDICVKKYRSVLRERKPVLSDFGNDTEDLVRRYLRDMDSKTQNLMMMFSWFPNVWDIDLLDSILSILHYDSYRTEIDDLLELSLFEKVSLGYKLHETFRRIARIFFGAGKGEKVSKAILLYLKKWLLASNTTMYRVDKLTQFIDTLDDYYDRESISEEEIKTIIEIIVQECYQTGDYFAWAGLTGKLGKIIQKNNISNELYVLCMNKYVFNLYSLRKYDEMYSKAQKMYDFALSEFGENHVLSLEALDNFANATDNLGNYEKAIELQTQCYEKRTQLLGEDNPDTLRSLNNLADSYNSIKNYDKAIELQERCFNLRKKVLGSEHIGTLRSMNNLAGAYERKGEHEKASQLREECYRIRRRVLGENHPDTLISITAIQKTKNEM